MSISFIQKVDKNKTDNHTPIDVSSIHSNGMQTDSKEAPENEPDTHMSSVESKPSFRLPIQIDRYVLLTIIAFLFFLGGLAFWIYVNFLIS